MEKHISNEDFELFFSAQLNKAKTDAVARHISSCDACRKKLANILRVASASVSEHEERLLEYIPFNLQEHIKAIMTEFKKQEQANKKKRRKR